ncbi:hypothetical protein Efla_000194 [Eimeria flavescens]
MVAEVVNAPNLSDLQKATILHELGAKEFAVLQAPFSLPENTSRVDAAAKFEFVNDAAAHVARVCCLASSRGVSKLLAMERLIALLVPSSLRAIADVLQRRNSLKPFTGCGGANVALI